MTQGQLAAAGDDAARRSFLDNVIDAMTASRWMKVEDVREARCIQVQSCLLLYAALL